MRAVLLALASIAAVAYAQDRITRCIVRVEVTDEAVHRAIELKRKQAPVRQLQRIKIHQPYKMVLSGVAISTDEIVTPALHPRAKLRVLVTLGDGKTHLGQVVGTDPLSDIALVRLPGRRLPHLALDEAPVGKGQPVSVVGQTGRATIALAGTVARERTPVTMTDLYGVNSGRDLPLGNAFVVGHGAGRPLPGSACIDARGRLAGMVVGGMPGTAANEMTFVLPAARLVRIVRDLREHGRVVRAYYGIQLVPATAALCAHFALPACASSVVMVEPKSPAAAAGLRRNDVILSIDAKKYACMVSLGEAMTFKKPGSPVSLMILRRGKQLTLSATPSERR